MAWVPRPTRQASAVSMCESRVRVGARRRPCRPLACRARSCLHYRREFLSNCSLRPGHSLFAPVCLPVLPALSVSCMVRHSWSHRWERHLLVRFVHRSRPFDMYVRSASSPQTDSGKGWSQRQGAWRAAGDGRPSRVSREWVNPAVSPTQHPCAPGGASGTTTLAGR